MSVAAASPLVPVLLAPRHKYAYAAGHCLNDLTASAWFGLVLLVFTQVDQLSKHDAGLLMLIGQVADAAATPMVGHWSDRTRTRWGARRPWHLAGCACVALSFPALMGACGPALRLESVGPDWARTPQAMRVVTLTYYSLVVVVFQLGWAAAQVAHMAICPELSPDFGERTALNSLRYAATVACNLCVYTATWAMLLGHTGPLRPEDRPVFERLSAGLVLLGVLTSVWFHAGMHDLQRSRDDERTAARGGSSAPASSAAADSWDSLEGGGGWVPMVLPAAVSVVGDISSWDSFEGFLCAAHSVQPPPQQPLDAAAAAAAAAATAATGGGDGEPAPPPHMDLCDWLRQPKLYAVAAQYMCVRLLLNVSQVYLPMYLVTTLRLPTACIAKAPLVLYVASLAATSVLRAANELCGRNTVMAASLLASVLCSLGWEQLQGGDNADVHAFAVAALLGWSSSCAMVTSLSMAADVIGDRHSSGAVLYGLLSLTDKLSSGIAIMLIQAYDPCSVPPADSGDGATAASSCEAAAANYYRDVMVYVPGGAAAGALAVLAASWSMEMLDAVLKSTDGSSSREGGSASSHDGDVPPHVERRTQQQPARRDAATQIADASVPLLSGQPREEEAEQADEDEQQRRNAAPAVSEATFDI